MPKRRGRPPKADTDPTNNKTKPIFPKRTRDQFEKDPLQAIIDFGYDPDQGTPKTLRFEGDHMVNAQKNLELLKMNAEKAKAQKEALKAQKSRDEAKNAVQNFKQSSGAAIFTPAKIDSKIDQQ